VLIRKCGKRNGKGYIQYKQFDKCLQTKETIDRIYYNGVSDYNLAMKLSKDARIGKPLPAIDIIVAAMALNRNMKLVTSDEHFAVIREIRQDFKLYIE